MATSFPTSLDAFVNPSAGDPQSNPPHAAQHADANDAIEALQTKVGVTGSADATSLDARVSANNTLITSGDAPGHTHNAAYEPLGGTFRGARASRGTSATITSATWTAVGLSTTDFESDAAWHAGGSTLTVPAGGGGKYAVKAAATFAANATGARYIAIAKNGVRIFHFSRPSSSVVSNSLTISDDVSLAAGDTLEVHVYQDSGADLGLSTAYLAAHQIGA